MTTPPRDVIYLDHHATTPVDPVVLEAMWPFFAEHVGNAASAQHACGRFAAAAVEAARERVAELVDADPRSVVFTSGATEANNLAIKGLLAMSPAGSHVVVSAIEHRSVLDVVQRLRRRGTQVTTVPVEVSGRIDVAALERQLTGNTVLVSVMTANNEIGAIQPVAEAAAVCRARGIPFHTDAVQACGRIPFSVRETGADLASLSSHKLYGPQGVGALIVRRGPPRLMLEPLLEGGGHEQRLRSGTLPVALIVGFGAACARARDLLDEEVLRLTALRDRLWRRLRSDIPDLVLHGGWEQRLPGNLNIGIPGVDGDALLAGLQGLAVSSGAACSSAEPEPSHVLRALGVSETLARASLRFGLGRFTTDNEIDRAADIVSAAVERRRGPALFPMHSATEDRP